jgi:regulator of nucleoside diphosphate kinase
MDGGRADAAGEFTCLRATPLALTPIACISKRGTLRCLNHRSFRGNIVNAKPHIVISERDAVRLEGLLAQLPADGFPGKSALEEELDRAEIVDVKDVPATVVTMNSTIRFKVASSDEEFRLTLVYPRDVDESGGTISVLAPVGSALLGLSQDDEIEWPKPGGGTLRVKLEEVLYQPERAGEYHR